MNDVKFILGDNNISTMEKDFAKKEKDILQEIKMTDADITALEHRRSELQDDLKELYGEWR